MKKSNRHRQSPKGSSCAPKTAPTLSSISQMLQKATINGPLPGDLHKDAEHRDQKPASESSELRPNSKKTRPDPTGLNSKSDGLVSVTGRYTPTCGFEPSRYMFENNNLCGMDVSVAPPKLEERQFDMDVICTELLTLSDCTDHPSVVDVMQSPLEMSEDIEVRSPDGRNLVAASLSVTDTGRQAYLQPMQSEFNLHPSSFGKTLCLIRIRHKPAQSSSRQCVRRLKYARFGYHRQIAGTKCLSPMISVENQAETQIHVINAFDFSTPSPDDIVRESQQKAGFCRK